MPHCAQQKVVLTFESRTQPRESVQVVLNNQMILSMLLVRRAAVRATISSVDNAVSGVIWSDVLRLKCKIIVEYILLCYS